MIEPLRSILKYIHAICLAAVLEPCRLARPAWRQLTLSFARLVIVIHRPRARKLDSQINFWAYFRAVLDILMRSEGKTPEFQA